MIEDGTRIVRGAGMITADVEDETIILNSTTGNFIQINSSAGRIWALLESPHTLAALCTLLAEQYAVSVDQCRAEVVSFIAEMREKGLVELGRD